MLKSLFLKNGNGGTFASNRERKEGYMKYNVFFLKVTALYPLEEDASFVRKVFFYLWRALTFLSLLLFQLQTTLDLVHRRNESFVELSQNVLQSVLYASGTLRTIFFVRMAHRTKQLVDNMYNVFQYTSGGIVDKESMEKFVKYSNNITLIWHFNMFITAISSTLPLIAFFSKTGYILPFPAWYPWNWHDYFFPTFFSQVFNNIVLGSTFANGDTFYLTTVLLTAKQWDVLGSNLKNFLFTALLKHGVPRKKVLEYTRYFNDYAEQKEEDNGNTGVYNEHNGDQHGDVNEVSNQGQNGLKTLVPEVVHKGVLSEVTLDDWTGDGYETFGLSKIEEEISTVIETREFQETLNEVIMDLIAEHKRLIGFSEELQQLLSPFISLIMGIGYIYMIFVVFCFTTAKNSAYAIGLVQYVTGASLQFFLYSVIGELLVTKSDDIQFSIWASPWYVCSQQVKRTLHFILLRAKKLQILSGSKVIIIRQEMFITIMRSTFSVYTLLRRMNTRNASAE